ncbi:MAG: AlkA N-terminal domain-containing protein [Steroidobacteraceae bacterium]
MFDDATAYSALTSRDPRFDGVFFVGVTSTGVYCRPVCPARTPRQENCRFFETAAAAEKNSFRPCLRCRPELAPGNAPVDGARRVAHLLARRIEEGSVDNGAGLEEIATQFCLSSRQLRRIVQQELGVSPIELLQTRRLLLAKQLLTETRLPVTQVAFASGFSSLRRFNDAFRARYRMPPGRLRKQTPGVAYDAGASNTSTVQLNYRPPYDWPGILAFLRARMMAGVEWISDEAYARTVRLGRHTGWIIVRHAADRNALTVEFTHTLSPVLPALLGRLRNLFDLGARPDQIAAHLMLDKSLRTEVRLNPGLRVPGAFDGFELATRAILGQQISVQAATTLACRFAAAFGETIVTPHAALNRLSPLHETVATTSVESVGKLGIVSARARSIIAIAQALQAGDLRLEAGAPPADAVRRLVALPGIGQWTAHYIAMRALRWPDAFPRGDVVIRNNLGGVSARQADAMSEAWRPWRSYAVFHIWRRQRTGR